MDNKNTSRRRVRHSLFQEQLEVGDKYAPIFAINAREALNEKEIARLNALTPARRHVVELLLQNGGDLKRSCGQYEGGTRTLPYFRVLCRRTGANLLGGEYSHHNVDADGLRYSIRNDNRRRR
jgi:hypothetical protein